MEHKVFLINNIYVLGEVVSVYDEVALVDKLGLRIIHGGTFRCDHVIVVLSSVDVEGWRLSSFESADGTVSYPLKRICVIEF